MTPTARTLAECRKRGWEADIVERRLTRTIKKDFLGIIDLIAIQPPRERPVAGLCCVYKKPFDCKPGEYTCATCGYTNDLLPPVTIGVQATSGSNHRARVKKALVEPRLRAWIDAGHKFEVWSWAKKGPRGKRKRWTLRIEEVRFT